MKQSKVVGLGLILAIALVAVGGTATPSAVGKSVAAQEAKSVVGALCWYPTTSAISSCTPGTHYICVFGTGGTTPTQMVNTTSTIAGNLWSAPCPCSSGFYAFIQGTCSGGS